MVTKKQLDSRVKKLETIVKDLRKELEESVIEREEQGWIHWDIFGFSHSRNLPTLKGKVDAIIEHLGIQVQAIDEKKEEAHVIAKLAAEKLKKPNTKVASKKTKK